MCACVDTHRCVCVCMERGGNMQGVGEEETDTTDRLSEGKTLPKLPQKIIMFSQDYRRKQHLL